MCQCTVLNTLENQQFGMQHRKPAPPVVAVGLMLSVFLFCICVESAGCFFALACSTRFFRLDNFYGSESKESNFHHLPLYLTRVSSRIGW